MKTAPLGETAPTPSRTRGLADSSRAAENQITYLVKVLGVGAPIPVTGGPDCRISTIAAVQRGRVTRAQLLEVGISSSAIYRRADSGRLHRLHSGVFAVGHVAPAPLAAETAALLACGDQAVLSHLSAARLWRLVPETAPTVVHVTVPRAQTRRPRGVRVHRTARLPASDMRVRDGLTVTSPARTLLDLAEAEDLATRDLERAIDEALVRRLVRQRELEKAAGDATGRRGAPVLSSLLRGRAGPTLTRSEAEECFLALVRAAELPPPEVNARLHGYEVDFLWRDKSLAVEVDGYRFHAPRAAFERDRRKDARLSAAGVSVMRVTWRQLQDESLAVVARVAGALA